MSVLATLGAVAAILAPIIAQYIYDAGTDLAAADVKRKAYQLAKDAAAKISANNAKLSELQNAYAKRDSERMTELMQDIGFGPRSAYIRNASKQDLAAYENYSRQAGAANAAIETAANVASNAAASAGGTFTGTKQAGQAVDAAVASADQAQRALQQSLQGGNQ